MAERRDKLTRRVCFGEFLAPYAVALMVIGWFLAGTTLLAVAAVTPSPEIRYVETPQTGVIGVDQALNGAKWLSSQQISVWFAIITVLFGTGIFLVIKWLLQQYSEQRIANSALQTQLIDYLRTDHQSIVVLQKESNTVMSQVLKFLERTEPILNKREGLTSG